MADANRYGQRTSTFSEAVRLPRDLPQSRPPLTIVCGAPGSGKTAYVNAHRAAGELVVDLDDIIQELSRSQGVRVADATPWLERALTLRNRRLAALAESDAPGAWFMVGAPTAEEREHWATMLGARRVVVIATPIAQTLRRIDADPLRFWVAKRLRAAACKWWLDHTPRAGEEIVTG